MTIGFDKPLYVLPFDHRGSFQSKMFGWEGALTAEQSGKSLPPSPRSSSDQRENQ